MTHHKLGYRFSWIHRPSGKHLFCLAQESRPSEGQAITRNLGVAYHDYRRNLALSGKGEICLIHRSYFICYDSYRVGSVYFGMGVFQIAELSFTLPVSHDSCSTILTGIRNP